MQKAKGSWAKVGLIMALLCCCLSLAAGAEEPKGLTWAGVIET